MPLRTAPLLLVALSGCFVGDFDRFHAPGTELGAGDAGASRDGEVDGAALGDDGAISIDAARTEAGSASDGALDAAAFDAVAPVDTGALEDAEASPDGGCIYSGEPRPLRVPTRALELGQLRPPASVKTRILSASTMLGTGRLWTFTSTVLASPDAAPATRPTNYPTSARDGVTAPWTEPAPSGAFQLSEVLSAALIPVPLLSLFPEEQNTYTSLFLSTLIPDPSRAAGALAFVHRSPGFFAPNDSVWIARIAEGEPVGVRELQPLFSGSDPLFGLAAYSDSEYVKLLACTASAPAMSEEARFPCVVARAPVARSSERGAYQVYAEGPSGTWSWSDDFARATPVLDGSDTSISLSWNPYLHKFLAVHSPTLANRVVLQTAASVEGPWTERAEVELSAPAVWADLYAREHPSAAQQCGKRIILSHWSPTEITNDLPTAGENVLSAIDLE